MHHHQHQPQREATVKASASVKKSASAPVVFKGDHDVLGIREDQLSPSLPERVHNVGDETNLKKKINTKIKTNIKRGCTI